MRSIGIAVCFSLATALHAGVASADEFPSRPVKVIVPFAAGGPVDVLARAVGERFRERTGQPLIVENKPGANTSIGATACKNAEPDGYTFCLLTSSTVTLNPFLYSALSYDPFKDFEPVTNLVTARQVLLTSTSVPVASFAELVALAKKEPDRLSFASFGTGGDTHLVIEWLMKKAGIKMLHVPYQGAAPAMIGFERGDVQVMYGVATPPVRERIRSGKAKGLLMAGKSRDPNLPDVPTFAEAGLEPLGYETWFGAFAPVNAPKDRIERLSKQIADIVRDADFQAKYIRPAGYEAVGNTPAAFKRALAAEKVSGQNLVEISGVKINQ